MRYCPVITFRRLISCTIDAEGFDYVILRQFDFTTLHPRIVLFEHKHLTNQDRRAAKTMMELAGYKVEEMETDFFALAEL